VASSSVRMPYVTSGDDQLPSRAARIADLAKRILKGFKVEARHVNPPDFLATFGIVLAVVLAVAATPTITELIIISGTVVLSIAVYVLQRFRGGPLLVLSLLVLAVPVIGFFVHYAADRGRTTVGTPSSPVLAYVAHDAIYIYQPGKRSPTEVADEPKTEISPLEWSSDGRYLATTISSNSQNRVWMYDTQTEHPSSWDDCGCTGVGFVGSTLAAFVGQAKIELFHPTSGLPQSVSINFKPAYKLNPIGASSEGLLFTVSVNQRRGSAYGGPENLYVVDLDGTVRQFASTGTVKKSGETIGTNFPIGGVVDRSDGATIAFVETPWHNGYCENPEYVRVIQPGDSVGYQLNPPDDKHSEWSVYSMSWTPDGVAAKQNGGPWTLYSVQSGDVANTMSCSSSVPRGLYESQNRSSWKRIPAPKGIIAAAVSVEGEQAFVVARGNSPDDYSLDGQLVIAPRGGHYSAPVAPGVTQIAWSD
jgi:WD40 repeat protein